MTKQLIINHDISDSDKQWTANETPVLFVINTWHTFNLFVLARTGTSGKEKNQPHTKSILFVRNERSLWNMALLFASIEIDLKLISHSKYLLLTELPINLCNIARI